MIIENSYRTFSLAHHLRRSKKNLPNVAQFELTFACPLNCRHCYSSCYNQPQFVRKELSVTEVKNILNELKKFGILWLCFTGGDPLSRVDFFEIYDYAYKKGFLISLFTSLYLFNEKTINYFKKHPPFVIETTINAVTEKKFDYITQCPGSFAKIMNNLKIALNVNLALKIKSQITKDNFAEYFKIKRFVEGLGLTFSPSFVLHARLNRNTDVCRLRIPVKEIKKIFILENKSLDYGNFIPKNNFFPCSITGGDGVVIDPYGNVVPCICIRAPKVNLLKRGLDHGYKKILRWIINTNSTHYATCQNCQLRHQCVNCPGKSLLETGCLNLPVSYFCHLSRSLDFLSGNKKPKKVFSYHLC